MITIGNYFEDKEGRLCVVEAVSKYPEDTIIAAKDGPLTTLPTKPIKLTTDWLKRFDFSGRKDFMWISRLDNFAVQIVNGKVYAAFLDKGGVIYRSVVHLEYVHDLQNAYQVASGESLKLVK